MRCNESERGSTLLVVMALLLALAFAGGAMVLTAGGDLKSAGESRRGTQAQFAAEAGIQEAMHRMALAAGTTITVNSRTFDPAIADPSSPLDPEWETRICPPVGTLPTSMDASIVHTPSVQDATQSLEYAQSGNFLTIRHKWLDRNGDNVRDADEIVHYDPSLTPPENFDSGSPVEVIEVEGHRGQARRRLRVEVTRHPFSPNVTAAITSDRGVDVRGSVSICGYNHRVDTPANTDLINGPCSPNWDMPDGHETAIMTTGDEVDRRGGSDMFGFPTVSDTSSANPFHSLADALGVDQSVIDRVLADADNTSIVDPLDGITYIQGDATVNNENGQGLFYVTGDLHITGNMIYRGLIYVEGEIHISGNPWILGGVLAQGTSDTDFAFAGGNPSVLYSRDMIRLALEMALDYVVLSWKEM